MSDRKSMQRSGADNRIEFGRTVQEYVTQCRLLLDGLKKGLPLTAIEAHLIQAQADLIQRELGNPSSREPSLEEIPG